MGKLGGAPYLDIQTLANETGRRDPGRQAGESQPHLSNAHGPSPQPLQSSLVSSNKKRDGTTRKLKIDVSPSLQKSQDKLAVKARRSYVAPRS